MAVEGAVILTGASGVAEGSQNAFMVLRASASYDVVFTLFAPWKLF